MADIPELAHSTQPTQADASRALLNDANAGQKSYLQTGIDAVVDRTFGQQSTVGSFLSHHVPEFLQTAALFTPGRVGMAASVAIGAANNAKMGDSFANQLGEAGLGAAKGGLTKFVFAKIGDSHMHPSFLALPLKGVSMGLAGRGIDLALTPGTWTSQGQFDAATGVSRIADNVFNKQAMILDGSVFLLSGIGSGVINSASHGLLDSSVMAKTVVNGATFGASSGGLQEIARQRQAGNGFDWGKIASASASSALIDGLAAAPGGYYGSRISQGAADGNTGNGGMGNVRRGFALATLLSLTGLKMGSMAVDRSLQTTEPINPDVGHSVTEQAHDYHNNADSSLLMRVQFPVELKAGDRSIFENSNGSVRGVGTIEVSGDSYVHVAVPEGGTMRIVIKGEQSDPTITVGDSSAGTIELVNQRVNDKIPDGLLDAQSEPRADVRVLHPLADVFTAAEIENIKELQEGIYSRRTPQMTEEEMQEIARAYYNPAGRQERELHFVMGPPGAGKTFNFMVPLAEKLDAFLLDGDAINSKLPGYDSGWGQVPVGALSKIIRVMVLKQAMENGDNIVFPVLGHRMDVMEQMIDDARTQGYRVAVHLIDLSPEESARRVYFRSMQPLDPVTGIRQVIDPEWALLRLGKSPAKVFDELISRTDYVDAFSHFHSGVPLGEPYLHIRSSTTAANLLFSDQASTTTTTTASMQADRGTAAPSTFFLFPATDTHANDNPAGLLKQPPQLSESEHRAAI